VCGAQRVYRALARSATVSRFDRDAWKDAVLVHLLAGEPAETLDAAGAAYADFLLNGDRLRPDALDRIAEHRERGHRVVIVSASPETYLHPLGQALGVDAALGTRLEVDPDGLLTGRMIGRNCRGPEKVTRLEAWLDGTATESLWAYGDSGGDRELLARADVGVRIRPRRPYPPLP
jgi:phosphatidylglycerophosphatase C